MFEQGKRKPLPRFTQEDRAAADSVRQFCKQFNIDKDYLAGCLGLASWHSLETNPNRVKRIQSLHKVTEHLRRAKIMHDMSK